MYLLIQYLELTSFKTSPYIGLGGGLGAAPWRRKKSVLEDIHITLLLMINTTN